MIQANNIHKRFGDLEVIKGVNLSVGQGEIVSIVGASGAGKTTLLNIMGTLDKPDLGELTIAGQEVQKLKEKQLAAFRNQTIGFVFQFHHLLPEFTALENVCIPGFISGKSRKAVNEKAKELLHFLGMAARTQHKPAQLSGGEQQRVAVARALINNPAVIFADEPSGNLDSKNKEELHTLFFTLREQLNQTFVIVTHDGSLANMSDRIMRIKDGAIVHEESSASAV